MAVNIHEGKLKQEDFWWGAMPEEMQRHAWTAFKLAVVSTNAFPKFRIAMMIEPSTRTDSVIPDIAFVSDFSLAWRVWEPQAHDAHLQRWRVSNVLGSYPPRCNLRRGQHAGEAVHVVCHAPSARLAAEYLAPRSPERPYKVVAVNRAAELVEADYWAVFDPLHPSNHWQIGPWLDEHAHRVASCHGLFALHSSVPPRQVVQDWSCYVPVHAHYRDLIEPQLQLELPQLIEGQQALPGVLHWCWWLGFDRVVLWGADQCRHVGRDYYATLTHAPSDLDFQEWRMAWSHEGKPVLVTPQHAFCHRQALAVMMWMRDSGCRVYDASKGLGYAFAPQVSPQEALALTSTPPVPARAASAPAPALVS